MFRTLSHIPFRQTRAAALLGVVAGLGAVGAVATPARAQSPVTVNFNTLVDTSGAGARYVDNCYTESGFTFTAVGLGCGTPQTFAAANAANPPAFIGSPALYVNDPTVSQVAITQANGGLFSMQSIVLGPFIGSGGTVGLTGLLANGMTVFQSFEVPDASPYALQPSQLYTLTGAFTGLSSVRMDILDHNGEAYLNFDDVTFTPSASTVPEPTTVVLLAGGLLGVGMFARSRGSRRRAASDLRA